MSRGLAFLVFGLLGACSYATTLENLSVLDRDAGGGRPSDEDASEGRSDGPSGETPPVDGTASNGIGTLETPILDFGKRILGSESRGTIIVNSDPGAVTRVRVLRIDGGSELSLDGVRIGEVLTIDAARSISIEVVFRVGDVGKKEFVVELSLCEAGCFSQAVVIAEVPEERPFACNGTWFLDTPLGSCETRTLECENYIDDDLEIVNVIVTEEFSATPISRLVPARSHTAIELRYCPLDVERDGTLAVVEVAARSRFSAATSRIEISGMTWPVYAGCTLSFSPTIDFGVVATHTRVDGVSYMTNAGLEPCRLTVLGTSRTSSVFRAESPPIGETVVLGLRQELNLRVSFAPTSGGDFGDRLIVATNDVAWPQLQISLIGYGFSEPGYRIETEGGIPLVAGRGMPFDFTPNANDGSARILVPFTFEFLDRPVSHIYVSSNGYIAFDPVAGNYPASQPIPSASLPNELLAWWWDDLDLGSPTVSATWAIVGRNAALVLTFLNVPLRGGAPSSTVNAQIRINRDDSIEVHYGEMTDPENATFQASAGWEGERDSHGADALGCSPICQGGDWPANTVIRYIPH
jgi:hypothetical protein